jgi:hypothetical protein
VNGSFYGCAGGGSCELSSNSFLRQCPSYLASEPEAPGEALARRTWKDTKAPREAVRLQPHRANARRGHHFCVFTRRKLIRTIRTVAVKNRKVFAVPLS